MGGRTESMRFVVAAAVMGLCTAAARADVVCTYSRPFDSRIPASAPATKGWMDDAIIDVPSHLIITDLDVTIDLTHTKAFDLQLYLQSPSGSRILLNAYDPFTQYFNGQDYRATTFDDEAATPIDKGSPPFTGSYRPLDPLSTFDGQDAYGRWRLSVYDAYYVNTGRFRDFTLTITVPEPATAALLGLGLGLLLAAESRRQVRHTPRRAVTRGHNPGARGKVGSAHHSLYHLLSE